jgi:hypothetical protein
MGGKLYAEAVVFCTGGFAGSMTRYGKASLIERIRPAIANLPPSNPPSATGYLMVLNLDVTFSI